MKMRMTVVYEYDTGDDEATALDYQTTDPDKCVEIDTRNIEFLGARNFIELADFDVISYTLAAVKDE